MKRKYAVLAAAFVILLLSAAILLAVNSFQQPSPARPFYVGVEFAYGSQFSQLKALVDQVKNYTNLLVIGSVQLTFNRTALDESCDYIFNAGLYFIVLFTSYLMYNATNGWANYTIFDWIVNASKTYGNQFLGIYRFDEPGGNQLDQGSSAIISNNSTFSYPATPAGFAEVTAGYVGNLSTIVNYYFSHTNYTTKIYTADYGLYWYDYGADYSTVFAEFVGNQSRPGIIALDRGAAQSFNEDWGVIIDWKYDQAPYLENGTELYSDLSLAYSAGATYAIIFSYPNITAYGTLTPAHFAALQKFWTAIHTNPGSFSSSPAEVAYVVPADFGFGFRSPSDNIWGLFPADSNPYTQKIWDYTQDLQAIYGDKINIIYDNSTVIDPTLKNYGKIFYWNQIIS